MLGPHISAQEGQPNHLTPVYESPRTANSPGTLDTVIDFSQGQLDQANDKTSWSMNAIFLQFMYFSAGVR